MLDQDGYQWFLDNGGLTRANGDRLRHMVLSLGNTEDPAAMYRVWLGRETSIEPMLRERRLVNAES
jgi:peptidyl-dipeptidase Dcp